MVWSVKAKCRLYGVQYPFFDKSKILKRYFNVIINDVFGYKLGYYYYYFWTIPAGYMFCHRVDAKATLCNCPFFSVHKSNLSVKQVIRPHSKHHGPYYIYGCWVLEYNLFFTKSSIRLGFRLFFSACRGFSSVQPQRFNFFPPVSQTFYFFSKVSKECTVEATEYPQQTNQSSQNQTYSKAHSFVKQVWTIENRRRIEDMSSQCIPFRSCPNNICLCLCFP